MRIFFWNACYKLVDRVCERGQRKRSSRSSICRMVAAHVVSDSWGVSHIVLCCLIVIGIQIVAVIVTSKLQVLPTTCICMWRYFMHGPQATIAIALKCDFNIVRCGLWKRWQSNDFACSIKLQDWFSKVFWFTKYSMSPFWLLHNQHTFRICLNYLWFFTQNPSS